MANTEIYYLLEDLGESSSINLDELLSNSLGTVRLRHGPQLTCNLFRSFPNCWNPSSSVTKVAESFDDAEVRACITRFLSNKVFSRSLSFRSDERGVQELGVSMLPLLPSEGRKH